MNANRLLSATALATILVFAPSAYAQTASDTATTCDKVNPTECAGNPNADPAVQSAQESGDILVTGSRIRRPNLDSTVPITSVSVSEITDTGDLSIGDSLNQLPSLRATYGQANSTRFIGTAGINQLDLRGLGPDRTLVLVNGRRHVSSVPGSYVVDTNTIPNALLEGVDVITGGASAVYGSDAIAGVVNFKLKRDYDGIEARVQSGVSDRGDRGSYLASIVAGRNFSEGRGNIAISAEYAKQNPVYFSDRNEQTGAYTGVPGFYTTQATSRLVNGKLVTEPPQGDGIPDTSFFSAYPGSTFGTLSLGGTVQTTCPALTPGASALIIARRQAVCTGTFSPTTGGEFSLPYMFLANGNLVRDTPALDLRPQGGGRFGGLSATGVEGAMLLPGLERYSGNLLFHYAFSPAFEVFGEGKYVKITANQTSTQPTFVNSTLRPTFFLDNPFLNAQARSTIQTILGTTSTTAAFTMFRFNNDIGTRAEDHKRETYRFVGGFRGDLSDTGNLNYEVALNYGRTNTYYETGGNVNIARFNAAANAFRDSSGNIVCRVNADADPSNDMPGCVPLNLFGEGNSSQAARNYVLYTSSRTQWAEEVDATAYISGDTSSFLKLIGGGAVGFSLGAEYRREDAFSDYDDFTQSGATFLNAIGAFNPPAVKVYEGFGELRIPLITNSFIQELSFEGAGRYSKYSSLDKGVWAYNFGVTFAPVRDIRFRAGYARSVRAPNLGDLYATRSQTFANNLVDPCSQGAPINADPNRARNCAAAGVPTTFSYTDDQGVVRNQPWVNTLPSGLSGFNQGNSGLLPEVGKSLTVGAVFEPRFIPGLALSVDYYRIKVENVIAGLTGQAIINRCYDDPVGIDNPFCGAVFRRSSTNSVVNGTFAGQSGRTLDGVSNNARDFAGVPITAGFLNQPFNYAALKTSGIDGDISYNHTFADGTKASYRALVSWLENREEFTFISAPNQSTRINGTLGDPEWRGRFSFNVSKGPIDFGYDLNYIGKMSVAAWEVQHTHQGRGPTNADAFPITDYAPQITHDVQLGIRVNDQYRLYFGVDNVLDTLPPYGLTGTGAGSGIYSVQGRFYYAGINLKL